MSQRAACCRNGSYPRSGPYDKAGVAMLGFERAIEEAVLSRAAGSNAGFGQPLRRSIKALDVPFMFLGESVLPLLKEL